MVISEFAEVATSQRSEVRSRRSAQEDERPVMCADCQCLTTTIIIGGNFYRCPNCGADICVMCGCTVESPCLGGSLDNPELEDLACHWINPGICSSHKEELKELALKVFG